VGVALVSGDGRRYVASVSSGEDAMSESSDTPATPSPGQVEVLYRFDVTYLKAGEHSLVIPIPDRIADLIGRIVVLFPLSLRSKPPSLYGDGGANSVA
jgi:hypothetical protein